MFKATPDLIDKMRKNNDWEFNALYDTSNESCGCVISLIAKNKGLETSPARHYYKTKRELHADLAKILGCTNEYLYGLDDGFSQNDEYRTDSEEYEKGIQDGRIIRQTFLHKENN